MTNSDRYTAPALEKGLDILELLSGRPGAMSLAEMAAALGRSHSQLFRMAAVLERRGYIGRSEEGYWLDARLYDLAMQAPPRRNLMAAALPEMERLAHRIDQSCHISIIAGTMIVVIARIEAPGEAGFAVRLGHTRRADRSTSAPTICAFSSAAEIERLLKMLSEEEDFDRPGFLADIDTIRGEGLFIRPSRIIAGVTDLTAPIIGETGMAVAALTVPMLRRARNVDPFSDAKRELLFAAGAISRRLSAGAPTLGN